MNSVKQKADQVPRLLVSVGKVVDKGKDSYVVTYTHENALNLSKGTVITFSMQHWIDTMPPQKGQLVELGKIVKFAKGWRALWASPVSPQAASNKEKK